VNQTDFQIKLKTLPEKPGVYKYLDAKGTIIYVGKAKNLKKRVNSYFSKTHDNYKTAVLVKRIVDLEYIVVDTELDALLLENNLIKKYQPRYNIQLKDDKTYPWICIKKEPFARVFATRKVIRDGSTYFGPYPNLKVMQALLDLIKESYRLRTCSLDLASNKIQEKRYKVCLEYHIGNCKAPCVGYQTHQEYQQQLDEISLLLKGNIKAVLQTARKQMHEFAQAYAYESAQLMKERIALLEKFQAKSTVVSPAISAVDVCTIINEPDVAYVNYLVIHNGAIIHGFTAEVKKRLDETDEEVLGYVLPELRERYSSQSTEVLLENHVDLSLTGIRFAVPVRGEKKQLVELSARNVKFFRLEKQKQEKIKDPERHKNRILEQIKTDFRLQDLPIHMECFDNSNIQGTNPVSACVVFKDGKPSKKDYRHFNVKTVEGPDDFATMQEAVYRRYRRLLDEEQPLPQLIIIDGGKGQLGAALKALEQLDLRGKVAICGIAKRLEEIFFPGDQCPIYIDKRSESLKVIQYMRNEAHRFGITHHRNKRSKSAITSELLEIPGIGPKTQQELMLAFKTVAAIKKASLEELARVVGLAKAKLVKGE